MLEITLLSVLISYPAVSIVKAVMLINSNNTDLVLSFDKENKTTVARLKSVFPTNPDQSRDLRTKASKLETPVSAKTNYYLEKRLERAVYRRSAPACL